MTAYDQYAIQAFDIAALDYLVKPFDDERFEQAFERARRVLRLEGMARLREQLVAVLEGTAPIAATAPAPSAQYLDRIAVELHGKLESVPIADIEYVRASGPYARLHTRDRRYVIRATMQALEDRLDPARFLRIHRSIMMRLDLIESLHRTPAGESEVRLKNGIRLKVSRSRREAVERWLGAA